MGAGTPYFLLLVLTTFERIVSGAPPVGKRNECSASGIAVYRLTLDTFWSEKTFSKQYPTYRPHAQWSRVIGRTHSADYILWREGHMASDGIKHFTEQAVSDDLDEESQGNSGVFDAFNVPRIDAGVGRSSTQIYVDNIHHMVSLLTHMIPSPDWFVGIDSVSMCRDNQWADKIYMDLGLWDAGTDKGLTFTSPNWPQEPRKPIEEITNTFPKHPACSFFYPELRKLPSLARVVLVRESVEDRGLLQKDRITLKGEHTPSNPVQEMPLNSLNHGQKPGGNAGKQPETRTFPPSMGPVGRKEDMKSGAGEAPVTKPKKVKLTKEERRRRRQEKKEKKRRREMEKKNRQNKRKKNKKVKPSTPSGLVARRIRDVNCEVSVWQEWSPCSKTCGYGTRTRMRNVLVENSGAGIPCPSLMEESMCGSMRGCGWSHFTSDNWGKTGGK